MCTCWEGRNKGSNGGSRQRSRGKYEVPGRYRREIPVDLVHNRILFSSLLPLVFFFGRIFRMLMTDQRWSSCCTLSDGKKMQLWCKYHILARCMSMTMPFGAPESEGKWLRKLTISPWVAAWLVGDNFGVRSTLQLLRYNATRGRTARTQHESVIRLVLLRGHAICRRLVYHQTHILLVAIDNISGSLIYA